MFGTQIGSKSICEIDVGKIDNNSIIVDNKSMHFTLILLRETECIQTSTN